MAPIVRSAAGGEDQLRAMRYLTGDTHPRFFVEDADFGMWIGARRSIEGSESYYWRITPFLLPFYTVIPPLTTDEEPNEVAFDGHAFVPIDDENTWVYNISWREASSFRPDEVDEMCSDMGTHGPTDDGPPDLLDGSVFGFVPFQRRHNMYEIDRERQRTTSFTGIRNANTQDRAVQELMGRVVDRSKEHLGTSDKAIIAFRRMMLALASGESDRRMTKAQNNPDSYCVNAASVVLDTDEDFVDHALGNLHPS